MGTTCDAESLAGGALIWSRHRYNPASRTAKLAGKVVAVGSSSEPSLADRVTSRREIDRSQDMALFAALIKRLARRAMASTGNGTRLRSSISSKGDMETLLFNRVSMSRWLCNARTREITTKRGAPNR